MLGESKWGLFLTVAIVATMSLMYALGALSQPDHIANIKTEQEANGAAEKQRESNYSVRGATTQEVKPERISDQGKQEPPETYVLPGTSLSIKFSDTAIIILTFFIALFTGGILWEEKNRSRKELRAYVALENIFFIGRKMTLPGTLANMAPDGVVRYTDRLKLRINNYGQTPSRDTTIWFGYSESGTPVQFAVDGPLSGKQMLHPGMGFDTDVVSPPVSNDKFWFWGHIVYRDIYERWWRTNFCYVHRGESEFAPVGNRNNESGPHNTEQDAFDAEPR